jgi:hypothetical protein
MGHPVRVAWCKILFGANGGRFTGWGMPIFANEIMDVTDDGYVQQMPVRGKCDRAFDCIECWALNDWLKILINDGWEHGWECDKCLRETQKPDRQNNIQRQVQGIYQAGRKKGTPPEDKWNFDDDFPLLEGCTRCGWQSSFLQLVLRKPR